MTQQTTTTENPAIPPEVWTAWLSYYLTDFYQRTGTWPLPPTAQPSPLVFQQTVMADIVDTPKVVEPPPPRNKQSRKATGTRYGETSPLPYYAEACRLIAVQHARIDQQHVDGSPARGEDGALLAKIRPEYLAGSQLLLSLIIAWLHFPLVNGRSGRRGVWMALPFDRLARELRAECHAGNQFLKDCLAELQAAGILAIGRVETGIITQAEFNQIKVECATLSEELGGGSVGWFTPKSFQKTGIVSRAGAKYYGQEKRGTNFYRLKPGQTLQPSLPSFNPFTNNVFPKPNNHPNEAGKTLVIKQSEAGKTLERGQADISTTFEPKTGSASLSEVFPTSALNESFDDDNVNIAISPTPDGGKTSRYQSEEHPTPAQPKTAFEQSLAGLQPEQKQSYLTLIGLNTRFADYQGAPVDPGLAVEYAMRYPMMGIAQAVADVTTLYEQGQIKKSPVGYVLNALRSGWLTQLHERATGQVNSNFTQAQATRRAHYDRTPVSPKSSPPPTTTPAKPMTEIEAKLAQIAAERAERERQWQTEREQKRAGYRQ